MFFSGLSVSMIMTIVITLMSIGGSKNSIKYIQNEIKKRKENK